MTDDAYELGFQTDANGSRAELHHHKGECPASAFGRPCIRTKRAFDDTVMGARKDYITTERLLFLTGRPA